MEIPRKIKNVFRLFNDKYYRMGFCLYHGMEKLVNEQEYLQLQYKIATGKALDFENPVTYTEKLQWLKVFDHRPEYTRMVDKYEVKQYVTEVIGEKYIVPMLGIWDDPDDIDFAKLPNQFVLKVTHDSGGLVICKDKERLDISEAKRKLERLLRTNYYIGTREWPYKNVKPRIIAEQYLEDSIYKELRDYKFFTFGGEPKILYIAQGRGKNEPTVADFFDMDFNHLPFTIDHDMAPVPPEKPINFELMKELAAKLSEGTPQLRVDFYEVDGRVYFGEMTFFHCSGLAPFHPEEWDRTLGSWVTLPDKQT